MSRLAIVSAVLTLLLATSVRAQAPAPGGAAAAKKQKTQLSKEQLGKFRAALKKGRKLEGAKSYAEALKSFDECLKIDPDDAAALSELGWTAYQLHDLKLAEKATRKSIENASTPNVKGASLYNLGRIQEDKGDRTAAIASYKDSLTTRPNAIVRARLKTLDPRAAAALDPFAPRAMDGPFPSIQAYCKPILADLKKEADEEDAEMEAEEKAECTCGDAPSETKKPSAKAPYLDMTVFTSGCKHGFRWEQHDHLAAVKMKDGWYVTNTELEQTDGHHQMKMVIVDKMEVTDLIPGGQPEASFRLTAHAEHWGGGYEDDADEEVLLVVGIGPSGKPSATPGLTVTRHEWESDVSGEDRAPDKDSVDVKLDLKFGKDGLLEVKGKTKGLDKQTAADLVGKHTLQFL